MFTNNYMKPAVEYAAWIIFHISNPWGRINNAESCPETMCCLAFGGL